MVKTKDDQQYGIVTSIVKQGGRKSNSIYMVQCYGRLPRVGPWLRKCSTMKTFPNGGIPSISLHDPVLIGYNYQDPKTGAIAYVYSRSEKRQLVAHAPEYEVPNKLVERLLLDDDDEDDVG